MFTTLDQLLVHSEYGGYARLEGCIGLGALALSWLLDEWLLDTPFLVFLFC